MSGPYWYRKTNGLVGGPHSLDEMRRVYAQGLLARTQQVSVDGGDSWRSASEFPELFERPARPPAPAPTPPPLPEVEDEHDDLGLDIDIDPDPAPRGNGSPPVVSGPSPGGNFEVFCRECGTGLKRRAVICPQCGVPTDGAEGARVGNKKNKYVAAMLAFLLGGFGAHHFYLGNPVLGIFYIVFCWTLIPALVAFIEFIVFLAMSESSFDRKYNKVSSYP